MAEEIQEAVQIIRVAYDGVEIAMKVGSGGLGVMKKALQLIKGMLDYEKTIGKTSMKKLVAKGGDLQVLQFDSADLKKVKKLAKKYGILYSVLPDINKGDGKSEVIFHSEAVARINIILEKINKGRVTTIDDYIKNSDEKGFGKLMDFFHKQKSKSRINVDGAKTNDILDGLIEKVGLFAMEKKTISIDAVSKNFSIDNIQAEKVLGKLQTIGIIDGIDKNGQHRVVMDKEAFLKRLKGYQDIAQRISAISSSKNLNLTDITINKKMIAAENDKAIKTRIPGTFGENARFIWVDKENSMDVHKGKSVLTFIDKDKEYKIYDKSNNIVENRKGRELLNNYDKVETALRERTDKMNKKRKEVARCKQPRKARR